MRIMLPNILHCGFILLIHCRGFPASGIDFYLGVFSVQLKGIKKAKPPRTLLFEVNEYI